MVHGVEQNGENCLENIWRRERSACLSPYYCQLAHVHPGCLYRLCRVYILFNAKHPLNDFDTQMLSHLSTTLISARGTQPFTLQSIITKADCIPIPKVTQVIEKMRTEIWKAAPLCLPPIITSAAMNPPFGVEELRQNIADACRLSLLRPPPKPHPT